MRLISSGVRFLIVGCVLCLVSCSASGRDGAGRGVGDAGGDGSSRETACSDGIDDDRDGRSDCLDSDCARSPSCSMSQSDGSQGDGFKECAGNLLMGTNSLAPVDIIWVVDSSDSMENDANVVQSNLDGFAAFIEAQSIDFHVVMISDSGFVTPSARFGTDPRFLFVNRGVGSNDAFDAVLDQHPTYAAHLRPLATTHVIGVTDDDENMDAGTFIATMNATLGHAFIYHAIASPPGECNSLCLFGCRSCVSGAAGCDRSGSLLPAADEGVQHYAAAAATGGRPLDICTDDWSGLFSTLAVAVAVAMPLPCVFEIPDPPAGMTFDRDLVNVIHTPTGGAMSPFPRVETEAACSSSSAWRYDNPSAPTTIMLCPAACTAVTAGPGMVQIQLGCASLVI